MQNECQFPEYVGKCNRENKCNYHYTPKDYFRDESLSITNNYMVDKVVKNIPSDVSYIPASIMEKSKRAYCSNKLFMFCYRLFGLNETRKLFEKYNVGTANYWQGATTFWQVDENKKIRTGKVMLYDAESGKRVKHPYNHIHWAHSILKLENFHLEQCFFGEHLLKGNSQTVAIVESEKTALIASQYLPQFLWLASGGKNGCLRSRIHTLEKRKVILFPDINAYEDWEKFAEQYSNISIFDFIELKANSKQKENGCDIADFLIQQNTPHLVLKEMEKSNTVLTSFIEEFGLALQS